MRRGDGFEFAQLRVYVPGDDPRRIDWAASARSGTLQTRLFVEESGLTLAAVVDASASMRIGRSRSLAEAADAALAVWFGIAEAGDRCVRVDAGGIVAGEGLRGLDAARACLAVSARESGDGLPSDRPFVAALRTAATLLPRGSALLAITDGWEFDDGDQDLLAASAWRHDCTLLLARDPWADAFPLRGFVRLRDAESGIVQRFFIDDAAARRLCDAQARREHGILQRVRSCGWRAAVLTEERAEHAVYDAFGL